MLPEARVFPCADTTPAPVNDPIDPLRYEKSLIDPLSPLRYEKNLIDPQCIQWVLKFFTF